MITLIRPPIIYSAQSYSTPITLPIGLAYIAAVLEQSNYEVNVIDSIGENIKKIVISSCGKFKFQGESCKDIIEKLAPTVKYIGITVMFSQEWPFIKKFIKKIKEKHPSVKIIIGGEHASAMPEYCLRSCPELDFVISGEGDFAFRDLIKRLEANQRPIVDGISFLENDKYFHTQKTRIININEIPHPAWHLFKVEEYFQPNYTMGLSKGRNMPILATRGCPYQCTFCSSPNMWTTRYSMRSPQDVIDEIEKYKKNYQCNAIDFYDLTAIVNRKWILEFTNLLIEQKVNIPWSLPSGTRSEILDKEVLTNLKKAGIDYLVYAPESGSNETLKKVKKKVNLQKMTRSIIEAKKLDISIKLNMVIGFPEETRIDVLKTLFYIWFLSLKGVDDVDLSTFAPYPGSELFDKLVAEKKIEEINDDYFKNLLVMYDLTKVKTFSNNLSSYEILGLRIVGMSIFYIISYIVKPKRILNLITAIMRDNMSKRLFDQRISDMFERKKSNDIAYEKEDFI